jgi:DNA-directed RNA polymerase subunit M/transcription elongation factor TFIIS
LIGEPAVDATELRNKAEQCLRLANSVTDLDISQRLKTMAADFLERAEATEPLSVCSPARQPQQQRPAETEPLPSCHQCKVAYILVGIESTDKPHHDRYTFECPSCGHVEARVIPIQ